MMGRIRENIIMSGGDIGKTLRDKGEVEKK